LADNCKEQHYGALRAFDPIDMKELWNNQGSRPDDYLFAKFVPPTVAKGKVFLATVSNIVLVYGRPWWAPIISTTGVGHPR
jgi:hypothetical protein